MAQNESNNSKPMNVIADDIDESRHLTELERIGARQGRTTVKRAQLEEKIRAEGKLLNDLIGEGRRTPDFVNSPFYQEQVPALRSRIKNIRSEMNSMDVAARARAESEASTYIARQFGAPAINAQVASMQNESSVQNRAMTMTGRSFDQLEARRQELLADIRVRERTAQHEVKGMFGKRGQVDPEKSAALGVMMGGTQEQMRELAQINAARAFQKAAGVDPQSKMKALGSMGQEANQILSAEAVAKEIKSGGIQISQGGKLGTVANEDVNKEIVNQARILAQALKELADGANKTDEELKNLRSTADESAENMKKLQDAQRAGAGGGGWNTANVAMGLASGFNAVGGAAQQIMVNQRMQQVANIGGFANLANQQYDMYQKARGGDVASQLALTEFGKAGDFGIEMGRGTNIALGAYTAGGVAQTAAGVAQAVEGGGQKFNPLAYAAGTSTQNTQAVIQGATNAVQGAATTAVAGMDLARQTSAGAANLAGVQAQMQARMALQAIPARQMQTLRDMYTGLDVVGQSMGGRASAFIQEAGSTANLSRMADARMSPEQFNALSQQGASQIGTTFSADQVFAARNLERRGFGSGQENMQRMATLAGAGANNPREGMESVLSAAVSKGLDSSKAINMMVENTASMVSSSAGAAVGIDTTAAASSLLANSMNPDMVNKEFALQQAKTAADITKMSTTNRDVSFTGMANTAGLQQALAKQGINLDGTQALIAQGVDIATLKSLQKDPKKASEFFRNQGVNVSENNVQKMLETTLNEKEKQLLRPGGFAVNADLEGLRKRMKEGKLSDQDELTLGQIANLQGRAGGAAELKREMQGVKAPNVSAAPGQDLTGKPGDPKDIKSLMDDLRTSGFKQLAEQAGTASGKLGDFTGAVDKFIKLQQQFEKDGPANESTFAEAAGKMAADFSAVAKPFISATETYATASQAMILAAKALASNRNPVMPQAMSDLLDKQKGSTRGN
jgi:hypothetical protein